MFGNNLLYFADARTAAAVAAALISCYIVSQAFLRIRNAYFTPLYQIPGPWYARITSRRLKYTMLMGKRVHYVNALHQKYGPIVRIAPNEVAIADPAASKEIHSISSRYLKVHVDIGPVPNIFSMTDPKQHNIRRRLYSKGFSQASLRKHWEPAVRDVVRTAVSKIKLDARSGTADIFKWWMLMSNDIICLLTIGEGFGMLEKGEKNYHIITAVELHIGLAVRQFSSLLYFLGQLLSPLSPALDNIFSVGKQLYGYGSKAVQKVRSEKDGSASQMTFFARALEDVKADNALAANVSAELSDAEICVDAAGFQLAGSDTVAITLTFLVWCVLGQSALQTRLEQEVAGISGEVTDAACDQLPLLNAVIDETLRLHGAAPTALRRVVPSGGAMLGGYRIPEAAIVATQAYSLHRNPDIWKDPETFDPARWLPGGQRTSKGTDTFMPFGAGTRSCAGIYLARMELRIAAAMFFRECPGAKLAASATPESMVVVDRFNTHPVTRRCEITFQSSEG